MSEARMVWYGWKGAVPISPYSTQVGSFTGHWHPNRRSALKAALDYRRQGYVVKIERHRA
jgi:hypothetical protein